MTAAIAPASDRTPDGRAAGVFTATNAGSTPPKGAWVKTVRSFEPSLEAGRNEVAFSVEADPAPVARMRVTVITHGDPL